jgi:hypothetical protein
MMLHCRRLLPLGALLLGTDSSLPRDDASVLGFVGGFSKSCSWRPEHVTIRVRYLIFISFYGNVIHQWCHDCGKTCFLFLTGY